MVSGAITSGTNVSMTGLDDDNDDTYRSIIQEEVLLLLATSPGDLIDKNTNQFVDATNITSPNTFNVFFNLGNLFIVPSIIQSIYPPIRQV
jgi:hypothetical protein